MNGFKPHCILEAWAILFFRNIIKSFVDMKKLNLSIQLHSFPCGTHEDDIPRKTFNPHAKRSMQLIFDRTVGREVGRLLRMNEWAGSNPTPSGSWSLTNLNWNQHNLSYDRKMILNMFKTIFSVVRQHIFVALQENNRTTISSCRTTGRMSLQNLPLESTVVRCRKAIVRR